MTRRDWMLGMAAGAAAPKKPKPAEDPWAKASEEALDLLRGYIRIDTSNPPGNVAAAVDYLAAILQKEGIATERFESVPGSKVNLVARLKGNGSKRPVLLLNHTDTVPADRSRWQMDPFGAEIRLNRLWGRGAVDMKSTGILHLMSMLLLKRNKVPLARDVIFAATADEEIGGAAGAGYMLENYPQKVDSEYVFDEGGFSANRLFAEEGEVYGVSVAQKQLLWLHLSLQGTGGHGSQPAGDNAIAALAAALHRIAEAAPPRRVEPVLDQMLSRLGGPLAKNRFTGAIQQNTISFTTFRAGVGDPPKENVVPSLATASLDCRLLPSQPRDEFIAWIRQTAAEPGLKIETVRYQPSAPPSSTDTELFHLIESMIAGHAPQARVIPYLTPFGTDGNDFRAPGRTVYGFFPVLISAEEAMSMHSDAERIPVAQLGKGLQIFYEVVERLSRAA